MKTYIIHSISREYLYSIKTATEPQEAVRWFAENNTRDALTLGVQVWELPEVPEEYTVGTKLEIKKRG